MFREVVLGLLVVLSVLAIPQPATAQSDDWKTTSTEHFVIEYKDGYESDANQMGQMIEQARSELLQEMPAGVEPSLDEPVHVRVYPGSEWSRPDGVLNWKNTKPVRIHVQSPSDSSVDDEWYDHGLAHEYANIVLWDYASRNANYRYWSRNPSWFGEGLSEYYTYRTPTVAPQYPPDGVAKLNDTIRGGNGDFDVISEKQYDGGHLLAQYMLETYGEDAVWDVLGHDGDSFSAAVEASLGVTYPEFKEQWLEWAEANVGSSYTTADQTPTEQPKTTDEETAASNGDGFGPVAALLAIVLLGSIAYRRRR